MADEPPKPIFPSESTPCFFADGIANFANTEEIFKFYLYRLEPSLNSQGPPDLRAIAQIVLSMSGLFGSVAFLNAAVKDIVSKYPHLAEEWALAQQFQARNFKPQPIPK